MATTTEKKATPEALPLVGQSRWHQIEPFLPFSRETWRKLCRDGKAPTPTRLSERCTVWNNTEIHRWLADPLHYRTEEPCAQITKRTNAPHPG
ncbi:helix-turn-helix transcriptional regulator [Paraburkholderia sediminicola]|uniref:helix-turn-helix transcriptional regulator n=1 Tax=Paraburkholderia sediminicola TaxID=458836 RepID=UPI0038BB0ACB